MQDTTRIAGVGWHLPENRLHYIKKMASDDTLHGYDLIIWNISGSTSWLEDSDIDRRRSEFQHHLAGGRSVVVLLGPEDLSSHSHRFLINELLGVDLLLNRGGGTDPEIVDADIQTLARWVRSVMKFHVYMTDPPGTPLLKIPKTDHVVGAVTRRNEATILFLPWISPQVAYDDEASGDAAADLIDMIVEFLDDFASDDVLPEWSSDLAVPGEAELLRLIAKDEKAIDAARIRISNRRSELKTARRRKLLVTAEGRSLERIAAEAFSVLGFDVLPSDPGRADLTLELGRRRAVVEVKGKTRSAAERDALQAAKWVLGHQVESGRKAKGILMVNGWRTKPLVARPDVFPNQMLKTAERQDLCLLTGLQLLEFWLEVEEAPNRARGIANRLMRTVGPVESSMRLGG